MAFDCLDCNRIFYSEHAIESHCEAKYHRRSYGWYCDLCDRTFSTERGLEQHCETATAHRTCDVCNRTFDTVDGYELHCERSLQHRQRLRAQQRPVECPICERTFNSPSAYAQHIESGSHGVNRHQITRAVQSLKVIPKVTLDVHPAFQSGVARVETLDKYLPALSPGPPEESRVAPSAGPPDTAALNLGVSTFYVNACHICMRTFRTIFAL
ncbi:hypothetical protein FA15DRAFT_665427 [Coprinopsis marcescibilis]|uniref:C2H2-type domain-containing protein n=1 Tax=Coprinopsis marcescibilis TaxID=230819 RepID=A0A5C3L8T0_COPMA|nr:hypothetical protein FA15DRAFT_665427 [Coprinopsis marcescibilis]